MENHQLTQMSKMKDKYLDLERELKKQWSMRVSVKLIVIESLETVPKGLKRWLQKLKIGGRIDIIQTTVLLRSTRILVPET